MGGGGLVSCRLQGVEDLPWEAGAWSAGGCRVFCSPQLGILAPQLIQGIHVPAAAGWPGPCNLKPNRFGGC